MWNRWVRSIQEMWELVTDTGVTVRPTQAAVQAMANKGYDVSAAQALLAEAQGLYQAEAWGELLACIGRINSALRQAPLIPFYDIEQPQSLAAIRASLTSSPPLPTYNGIDYLDRVHGAWLGKIIGGALGMPVEGWQHSRIAAEYGSVAGYLNLPTTLNDDTAYQIVLLHALEEHGPQVSSEQLAWEWVAHLPMAHTAELVAIENLKRGILPPDSGRVDNPFSHWIGAMMRGEICGLVAPGRPDLAIELAFRDAVISHETEGVYGELFNAAMVAAAFVESDVRRLLQIGLAHVPPRSQFSNVIRETIGWCELTSRWQEAWARAEAAYAGRYHWIHTFPNVAAVVVGLWFGEGNFDRTICITTMCGQDTDCTAGQVGAVVGTIIGIDGIPARWREPIGDELESYAVGFEKLSIFNLARRTCLARLPG